MVTAQDPLAIWDLADELRECIEERLTLPVNRSCVITGEIAWDDCECGQLVVSIVQRFPSTEFPNEGGSGSGIQSPCGANLMVADLLVSILRCSPETGDETPPSCAELAEAAKQSVTDAWSVNTGVWCCLKGLTRDRDIANFQVDATTFVGAAGMCQGSETVVHLGLLNGCPPCDDDGPS